MNFENLKEVPKANTRRGISADYRLKWNSEKARFSFSAAIANEINLPDNSLIQLDDEPNAQVFLAIAPGNSGVWAKSKANKVKGRTFTNQELSKSLTKFGYIENILDLVKQDGLYKDMPVYKVVEVTAEQAKAPKSKKPAAVAAEPAKSDF